MNILSECENWMSLFDEYGKYVPRLLKGIFKVVRQVDLSARTKISKCSLSRASHGKEFFSPTRLSKVIEALTPIEKTAVQRLQERRSMGAGSVSESEESQDPARGDRLLDSASP